MNKVLLLITGTLLMASGCSSTVAVGPQANKEAVVGASLSTSKVGVTVPLLKASVQSVEGTTEK
ncbi:hypothetical protein CMI37_33730 [Candidatus Pacearchaeota archaeon]|nr:hypothetical protein [Candidatus Pacearchaeota archaeon]